MPIGRREMLRLTAGGLIAGTFLPPHAVSFAEQAKIKAIAFDAFPIFDPRPIFAQVKTLFPEKGEELSGIWRSRQFEYTWLRASAERYRDFWDVTQDALVYAAEKLKLDLTPEKRDQIMAAYLQLKAWPDVVPALEALKEAGLKLGFLSNFTPKMLTSNIRSAGLDGYFSQILSTDKAKTFKPAPHAYQLGVDAYGHPRDQILFVPFAAWDAAGAKWFGYPTFWVNRIDMLPENLGTRVDAQGRTLTDLVSFLDSRT